MPRPNSIKIHPQRKGIEKAILKGNPLREISRKYAVSEDALYRYKHKYLPKALEKVDTSGAKSVYERFEALYADAEKSYAEAEKIMDKLAWSRELRGYMGLAYKLGIEANRRKEQEVFTDMTPAVKAIIDKEFER